MKEYQLTPRFCNSTKWINAHIGFIHNNLSSSLRVPHADRNQRISQLHPDSIGYQDCKFTFQKIIQHLSSAVSHLTIVFGFRTRLPVTLSTTEQVTPELQQEYKIWLAHDNREGYPDTFRSVPRI